MKLKYSLSQFASDSYNLERIEHAIINLQEQIDILAEEKVVKPDYNDDIVEFLLGPSSESYSTFKEARKEVIEDDS